MDRSRDAAELPKEAQDLNPEELKLHQSPYNRKAMSAVAGGGRPRVHVRGLAPRRRRMT